MSKYDALTEWLKHPQVTLSFREIEQIIAPETLTDAARQYRPWWGNERNNPSRQCHAWLDAGWKVDKVDLKAETVTFRRV